MFTFYFNNYNMHLLSAFRTLLTATLNLNAFAYLIKYIKTYDKYSIYG